MGSTKQLGIGLYEFLIESELQQYYNAIKNDLKVQSVTQLKYVSDDDMTQIGMSRPEIRRLKKFFHKHCPQTYLAKMKKKLLSRREDAISVASMSTSSQNAPGRVMKSIAPGRHIIQAESIVIHKTLGSGEFGTVQQGVWTSDDGQRTQVAIKCLSQERMENNPVEFLKEAAIMHTVDHEHIVRLYGVVLDTSALMLVTELAPLRSLLECLKEPSMRRNLSVPTLYDFAVQICDGMQYLESKRLIHRDLAARNILVFSRSKVKISDFGLSRALGVGKDYYQTNFNVNLKLPIAWCAPECINFLRFTSASDVWAYGVALWEMFSYGFQPWAALTGQQILEAIDEPNYQRLERPECCPNEIYCQIMLKCWQHDPIDRPTFTQLSHLILECKPETVQAIRESEAKPRRDFLVYDAGDVITVLDRMPPQTSDEAILWKGVLKCGKSGLFHPGNTITYLGSSLPSVAQSNSPFHRNDSRSSSMRKGKISADMISGPQGDLKHTGHVGTDGQFFGDITFLGSKCWVPRQVVSPYKPEELPSEAGSSSGPRPGPQCSTRNGKDATQEMSSSDTIPLLDTTTQGSTDDGSKVSTVTTTAGRRGKHNMIVSIPGSTFNSDQDQDHEYHEISDEENEIMGAIGGCRASSVGLSNPALSSKSQSPLDSPRFEKSFDLGMGPSLIDEVFSALQHDSHQQPVEAHNVKNELREMARAKKKFASVKPISSSDRRTLDQAIVFVNELASRSMLDLDRSGKNGLTNNSLDDISSPRTPNSPSHRRKFSFILGSGKNDKERRNYSQEAASIPDIQSTLTEEAKEAYNSLVEKPSMNTLGFLTPSFENKSMSFHFPEKCSSLSKKADFFEPESKTLNGPQSLIEISPTCSNNAALVSSSNLTNFPGKSHSRSLSKSESAEDNNHPQHHHTISSPSSSSSPMSPPAPILLSTASESAIEEDVEEEDEVDGNPLRLLRQNKQAFMTKASANVLPLPPKKGRGGSGSGSHSSTLSTRHQRKHPLLIPGRISSLSSTFSDSNNTNTNSVATAPREPPVPPPKPQRQLILNSNSISSPIPTSTSVLPSSLTENNSDDKNDNILLNKPETAFTSSTEPVEKTLLSPEKDIGIAQGGNQCQGNTDITLETNNHRHQLVGQRPSLHNSENSNSVKKLNVRQRLSASSFTTTENREREPCTLFTSENSNLISNTNGHPNPNSDRYRYSRDRPDSSILLYENILAEGSVGSQDSILTACVQVVNKNSSSSTSNNCNGESQCQNQSNAVSSSSFTAPTITATTATPNGSGTTETLEDHPIRSRNRLNSDNSCSLAGAGTGPGNYRRLSSSSVASAVSLTPSSRNSSSSGLTEQSFQSTNESSNSASMNNSSVTLNNNSELNSSSTASTVSSMVTARGFHSRSGSISIVKDLSIVPSTKTTTTVATAATIAVNNADTTPVSESVPAQNQNITIISHPMKITPGDSVKIKKLQRILGPSTSEEECDWALDATDSETNHAVKLLRLKYLLPESLITDDARPLVSALEMSHWDVARASDFLLHSNAPNAKPKSSRPVTKRTSLRTELTNLLPPPSTSSSNDISLNSNLRTDLINNNGTPRNTTTSTHNDSTNSGDGPNRRNYIRPTHV